MARINHVITHGIGVPGDIEHVILMELNISPLPSGIYLSLVARLIASTLLDRGITLLTLKDRGNDGLDDRDVNNMSLKDRTGIGTPTSFDIPRMWDQ